MSGFDKDWLALREPADMAARDPALLQQLSRALTRSSPQLLDIGCGTGSTYRTLRPKLPESTRWTLLDYDPALIAEARRRIGSENGVTFCQFDLNQLDDLPLQGIDCITASALFDLCSAAFCDRFAARIAGENVGLYAALNYDGVMTWTVPHALDAEVVRDFNTHQQSDKGLGPALGPSATSYLKDALTKEDYTVLVADSPWILESNAGELQVELLSGIANAVLEVGNLRPEAVSSWLAFRTDAIAQDGSLCRIGHTDLLAMPSLNAR